MQDDIDLLFAAAFAAGFFVGGFAMVRLITHPWPPHLPEHHVPAGYAILIGAVAGLDLAAWIGRTPYGAAVMGVIVGCLAVVRARITT